jgi:hypothetical protein
MLFAVLLLIGWDIWVAANSTPADTISEIVLFYAGRTFILPLSLGVVSGHLLWPIKHRLKVWMIFTIFAIVAGATVFWDVVGHPHIPPMIPFAFGVLLGHFVWGQREE